MSSRGRPTVAFVLSGGASLGAVQVIQPIDFGHADELIARALHDARLLLRSQATEPQFSARTSMRPSWIRASHTG